MRNKAELIAFYIKSVINIDDVYFEITENDTYEIWYPSNIPSKRLTEILEALTCLQYEGFITIKPYFTKNIKRISIQLACDYKLIHKMFSKQ